ncbi:(2Fe-2S)-binding protein [Actinokineospora sp. G85]|uniref:(2Fe-2S)-binding protein n=1 Tax=Actinokineospora sp. G85 TaxID=3406626 RepID=UPI003C7353A8
MELVARLRLLPELAAALGAEGKRRSCCLYYRSPVGGVCADCPLEGSKATEGKCVHCG